ncbi:hypothetical protein SAMN04487980_100413 [Streptomyces sp. cf124]|nr:hypothetical protein SAMN04487980_100413 [Streptomyces sp. cf124]
MVPLSSGHRRIGADGCSSGAGGWGLVAQFPAPLKDQALRAWKTTAPRV